MFSLHLKALQNGRKCSTHSEQCYKCGRKGHFKDFEHVEKEWRHQEINRPSSTDESHINTDTQSESQVIQQGAKHLDHKQCKTQ